MDTVYVRYEDDGPSGICGQACSITNPWDILHIFDDESGFRDFMKSTENITNRLNPRVTTLWFSGDNSLVPQVQDHRTTQESDSASNTEPPK